MNGVRLQGPGYLKDGHRAREVTLKGSGGEEETEATTLPAQGVCSELDRAQPHASGIERPHWAAGGWGEGVQSKARHDRVVLGWRGFGARSRVLRP